MKDKIALQVYSVRDDLQADVFGTLKKVKEMGYAAIEFAGLYGNDPVEIKKFCEEIGLVPLSAHVPFASFQEDPEGPIECYKKLGVQYINIVHVRTLARKLYAFEVVISL